MPQVKEKVKKEAKEATPKQKGDLTNKEVEVLKLLSKGPKTKKELWEKCKAGSGVLGAGTKDGAGEHGENSLIGRGFIAAQKNEGERGVSFVIKADGKKALEKALKS